MHRLLPDVAGADRARRNAAAAAVAASERRREYEGLEQQPNGQPR
jgi:hypothetical protein